MTDLGSCGWQNKRLLLDFISFEKNFGCYLFLVPLSGSQSINIDHCCPPLWKHWLICVGKTKCRLLQTIQEQGIVVSFPVKKAWDFVLESGAAWEGSSEVKHVKSRETIKIGGCHTSLFPCALTTESVCTGKIQNQCGCTEL